MDAVSPWGLKSCIGIRVRALQNFFFLSLSLSPCAMRATLTRQKGLHSMDSNVPVASTQMSATKTTIRDGPKREAASVSDDLASRPLSR